MDEKYLEMAERLEESQRRAGIARAADRPETHPGFDGMHCVEEDCGEPIPAGRLRLGKVRCTTCATIKEQRRAR